MYIYIYIYTLIEKIINRPPKICIGDTIGRCGRQQPYSEGKLPSDGLFVFASNIGQTVIPFGDTPVSKQ